MLTVRTLVTEVGLELAAGEDRADAPVRWVHITELPDPTPWLSGYELPFIALTERAFTTLVNEQYDVLQRGIAIHRRLERLVLEERGLEEVVRALAAAIGGAVAVLSARGETIASKVFRRRLSDDAVAAVRDEVHRRNAEFASGAASAVEGTEFAPEHPELA